MVLEAAVRSIQIDFLWKKASPKYLLHNCACVVLCCDHRLSCANCSRIYWKTTFVFDVTPLSASWTVLCLMSGVLVLFNLCCFLKEQLLRCRCAFISVFQWERSLIQQWKGFINWQWSESNWIYSIKKYIEWILKKPEIESWNIKLSEINFKLDTKDHFSSY